MLTKALNESTAVSKEAMYLYKGNAAGPSSAAETDDAIIQRVTVELGEIFPLPLGFGTAS